MSNAIEDVFTLSPAQRGMLLAAQAAPELHSETFTCLLEGPLDPARLRLAWERTAASHSALRTSFHWSGLPHPVQVVHRVARVVWDQIDSAGSSEPCDWRAPWDFDLDKLPLTRWTLLRLDENRHRLIWSYHHLILDGWSVFLLLRQALDEYAGIGITQPPPVYRSFIAWLERQDLPAAKEFWRSHLDGYIFCRAFTETHASDPAHGEFRYRLDPSTLLHLKQIARQERVALSTIFQAAWTMLLARRSGARDVVYGLTVSGRPAELPHSEQIAGMFINTIPVRVDVGCSGRSELLAKVQDAATAVQRWSFVSPSEIRDFTGDPQNGPLFESVLVFQNYPLPADRVFDGVRVSEFDGSGARSHYAITVLIAPGEPTEVRLIPGRGGRALDTSAVMEDYKTALQLMAADRVSDWLSLPLRAPQRRRAEELPPHDPIARIWAEALGCTSFLADDDLFQSGGDSLSAVKLTAAIKRDFGIDLSPFDLLRERITLRRLTAMLQSKAGPAATRIPKRPDNECAPLSYAQQSLWAFERMTGGSVAYNGAIALRFTGALRVESLKAALASVIDRQQSLRTIFLEREGQPYQRTIAAASIPETVEFEAPDAWDAAEYRRAFAAKPFRLEEEPGFRASLLHFEPPQSELLISMHHIVCDGWSVSVFLRELAALYGETSPLPPLSIDYADYAVWQQSIDPAVWAEDLAYWNKRLASPPRLCRPASQHLAGRIEIELGSERATSFSQLCRHYGLTLFTGLLACYQAALSTVFDAFDIVTGTPLADRELPESEGVIGLMLNTIVMRTNFAGDPTIAELFDRVRATVDDAYRHRAMPFELARRAGGALPFEFWFVLDNTPVADLHLKGVSCTVTEIASGEARFPLALLLRPRESSLEGYVEFNPVSIDHETANAVLREFIRIVDAAADDSALKLDRSCAMSALRSEFAF
jgi:hypothetical protein